MIKVKHQLAAVSLAVCAMFSGVAMALTTDAQAEQLQEVQTAISASLRDRMPSLPAVSEVRTTPIDGLYEVRIGAAELIYSDAQGRFLLQGDLIDIEARLNLTQERMNVLTAIDFDSLPLDQAIVIQRGDGSRKLAVFEDPNCGYCHRFEQQLATIDNVTVYVFLYPILSPESLVKSRDIWCADNQQEAWMNWMVHQQEPAEAVCSTEPIERNVILGQGYRITGTPTLIFEDGSKVPGAIDAAAIEARLAAAQRND